MRVNIFEFPVGTYRTATSHESQLGALATQGAAIYRLVKATAAIATPSGLAVTSALASGTKSWSVNLPATAGVAFDGVIPAEYGTTTIPLGAYFWIQVSGIVPAIVASTTAIGGSTTLSLLSTNTAGGFAPVATGAEPSLAVQGGHAIALNTAVLTASGGTANVQLFGII